MAQLYEQKELEASDAIAARCNVEMAFPRAHLPVYENRYGVSSVQFLNTLCKKGLAKRIGSSRVPKAYVQRLQYELEVINSMGFTDYFLIVWDFIRYARSQKIFHPPRTRLRGRIARLLLPGDHAYRSHSLRPAV